MRKEVVRSREAVGRGQAVNSLVGLSTVRRPCFKCYGNPREAAGRE